MTHVVFLISAFTADCLFCEAVYVVASVVCLDDISVGDLCVNEVPGHYFYFY